MMCLGELVGSDYYTDETVAIEKVKEANGIYGEDCIDFWYKELNKNQ